MKLLLTSNGLCNESIREALRGMMGKPTGEARMVFVPTGSWPVRGDKTWLVDDMRRAHDMGWKQFEVVDITAVADWPKELWMPVFEKADVIMFCGGYAQYLSYWLQKSGLMDALPQLLRDQNKVYVGISAGSMVATKSLATSSSRLRELMGFPDDEAKQVPQGQSAAGTLGLTDFLFRPHFNSPLFPTAREDVIRKLAAKIEQPVYLVDDETAVRVVGDKVDVVSEGEWLLL